MFFNNQDKHVYLKTRSTISAKTIPSFCLVRASLTFVFCLVYLCQCNVNFWQSVKSMFKTIMGLENKGCGVQKRTLVFYSSHKPSVAARLNEFNVTLKTGPLSQPCIMSRTLSESFHQRALRASSPVLINWPQTFSGNGCQHLSNVQRQSKMWAANVHTYSGKNIPPTIGFV